MKLQIMPKRCLRCARPFGLALCLLGLVAASGLAVVPGAALAFSNSFSVELPKYLGDWYEYARTPNEFEDNTLSRDGKDYGPCFAARTTYKADGADAISLTNACERRADDGSTITESITGRAVLQPDTNGRKLRIAFGSGVAQFFQRLVSGGGFAYWIYCLGPVDAENRYEWAVVSGPDKDYIFVLTRDRTIAQPVRSEILGCSSRQGLPVDKLIFRQFEPSE